MDAELVGIFKRLLAILHSSGLTTPVISTLDHHTDEEVFIKVYSLVRAIGRLVSSHMKVNNAGTNSGFCSST